MILVLSETGVWRTIQSAVSEVSSVRAALRKIDTKTARTAVPKTLIVFSHCWMRTHTGQPSPVHSWSASLTTIKDELASTKISTQITAEAIALRIYDLIRASALLIELNLSYH